MSTDNDTASLRARARNLADTGRGSEAEDAFRALIEREPEAVDAHAFLGLRAFAAQRYADAVEHFEHAAKARPADPRIRFNLATALEMDGQADRAVAAYLEALRSEPGNALTALFCGAALDALGREDEAAQVWSLATGVAPNMLNVKSAPHVDPAIRRRAARAETVLCARFRRLHEDAVAEAGRRWSDEQGEEPDLACARDAIWIGTHDAPITYRNPLQRPTALYVPGLPDTDVFDPARFDWTPRIEAAIPVFRDEFLAAQAAQTEMVPYVPASMQEPEWENLRGTLNWASMHLFKDAQPTKFTKLFPRTLEALEPADLLITDGNPVEIFFSVITPGSHIPAHYGPANNRITVQAPLIIPDGASIRIGNDIHEWRDGQLLIFDDTFDHEVWNRGAGDRVVLIFGVHHPDLTLPERAAIAHSMAVQKQWLADRAVPAA